METHKRLTHYDHERIASLLLLDYKPELITKVILCCPFVNLPIGW